MREFPKDKQCGENLGNRAQSESLAPQNRLHLEEPLLVQAEGKIASMQSFVAKSKRILQMLSRV